MPATARFPLLPYLFAWLGLFALCGFWYGLGQPVILPDAATPTHKLQCASYTPFDKDQSPFDQPFKPRLERMDADLALLATRFECIRIYSMTGLEAMPELARKHGLKLMIGAWVNSNPVDTEKEVDALIASANANADVVSAVIVGNETLLRKEVTTAQLVRLIHKVKAHVKQPVTYADVWEFWLSHPEVAPAVDFLTIHLLPYWEDDPAGIDAAIDHVAQIRQTFGNRFAPKDILIGETGSLRPTLEAWQRRCGGRLLGPVRCRPPGQGHTGRTCLQPAALATMAGIRRRTVCRHPVDRWACA